MVPTTSHLSRNERRARAVVGTEVRIYISGGIVTDSTGKHVARRLGCDCSEQCSGGLGCREEVSRDRSRVGDCLGLSTFSRPLLFVWLRG